MKNLDISEAKYIPFNFTKLSICNPGYTEEENLFNLGAMEYEEPNEAFQNPDLVLMGSLIGSSNWDIEGTSHKLYVTTILTGDNLDYYRLKGSIWSSYHENKNRIYSFLFQILPSDYKPKLLTKWNP